LLGRDRIGKKPLFYRQEQGRVLFASELKSILSAPDVPRAINPIALDAYLTYQYVPHPLTIFDGISKLPPGHYVVWKNGQLNIRRYWNPDFNKQNNSLNENEWIEELKPLLADAVKIRLRSDVPLGAFLSGGMDSSVITSIMAQESNQQIRTFSIGFGEADDETPFALSVAKKNNTLHREFIVTANIQDILSKLVWHYDEPFADQSSVPTWYLCEQTRREVTVALSGDGGDELFAGYDRHRAAHFGEMFDRLPLLLRKFLTNIVYRIIPNSSVERSLFRKLQRLLNGFRKGQAERITQWIAYFNPAQRYDLYTKDFYQRLNNLQPFEYINDTLNKIPKRDAATQLCLLDLQTYLPGAVMTKVDIASMAHSLECRSPFLDYRVVELATQIPIKYKIKWNQSKFLLRNTYKNLLPADVVNRRDKRGFGGPTHKWYRGDLKNMINDVLRNAQSVSLGLFRQEGITKILDEHFSEQFDHSKRIWALFMLEMWIKTWFEKHN
jgi:asparagine synthase (glutamine-hydrolysing)